MIHLQLVMLDGMIKHEIRRIKKDLQYCKLLAGLTKDEHIIQLVNKIVCELEETLNYTRSCLN